MGEVWAEGHEIEGEESSRVDDRAQGEIEIELAQMHLMR